MNPELLAQLGISPETWQALQGSMAGQQRQGNQQQKTQALMGNAPLLQELRNQGLSPQLAMLNALRQGQQPQQQQPPQPQIQQPD